MISPNILINILILTKVKIKMFIKKLNISYSSIYAYYDYKHKVIFNNLTNRQLDISSDNISDGSLDNLSSDLANSFNIDFSNMLSIDTKDIGSIIDLIYNIFIGGIIILSLTVVIIVFFQSFYLTFISINHNWDQDTIETTDIDPNQLNENDFIVDIEEMSDNDLNSQSEYNSDNLDNYEN